MVYLFQKLIWPPFVLFAKIFLKLKVRGQENFRKIKQKQYFIIANHRGYLDAFLVCASVPFFHFLKTDFRYMMKPKWFKVYPFVKFLGAYPIYRKQDTIEKTLEGTESLIKKGKNLLIFPEGTFPKKGEKIKPKRGIAYLAKKYKLPMLPIALKGSDGVNGKKGIDFNRIFSKKHNIEVSVGEPFFYSDVVSNHDDYEEAARKIMDRVEVMLR